MTYPNILPINVGCDGWSPNYSTVAHRVLFLCGLRPVRVQLRVGGTAVYVWDIPADAIVHTSRRTQGWDKLVDYTRPKPRNA